MLDKHETALIKKVCDYRDSQHLSDSSFSAILSIPRTTWAQHKNLKRPIGMTLLRAIVRTFPDLIPDVIEFLKTEPDDGKWKWDPSRFGRPHAG